MENTNNNQTSTDNNANLSAIKINLWMNKTSESKEWKKENFSKVNSEIEFWLKLNFISMCMCVCEVSFEQNDKTTKPHVICGWICLSSILRRQTKLTSKNNSMAHTNGIKYAALRPNYLCWCVCVRESNHRIKTISVQY